MGLWLILGLFCVLIKITEQFLRSLQIRHNSNRYVLVTGCDSGFGYRLTKQLDLTGFHVFAGCLTDDGITLISEQCSSRVNPIPLDVTCDDSIRDAVNKVKQLLPDQRGLWAVVNNAGILGGIGPGLWQCRHDYDTTMSINVHGMAMVTNAFISLVKREKGRIINMSSVLGRLSLGPLPYCVSKYGVEALSDGLRRELYWTGVKVCIIEPGNFTTTLLDKEAYRRRLEEKVEQLPGNIKDEITEEVIEQVANGFNTFVDGLATSNIDMVTDAYFHAITSRFPKKRYLVGYDAHFFFCPLWMLPECISDFIIAVLVAK